MQTIELTPDGSILIKIPMSLRTFSGRRRVITPEDKVNGDACDDSVITAFARASHWQMLIDSGQCESAGDIARKLRVNPSYVMRIMRLNEVSPRIVSRFLHGNAPDGLSLTKLLKKLPQSWEEQEQLLLG